MFEDVFKEMPPNLAREQRASCARCSERAGLPRGTAPARPVAQKG